MRVGISGTGFIARGMAGAIGSLPEFDLASVLTRRRVEQSAAMFPGARVTTSLAQFVDSSDLVIECSGDTVHAAKVMLAAG